MKTLVLLLALSQTRAQYPMSSPATSVATFLLQTPLQPSCAAGRTDYTSDYCSSHYPQSPINIDTTRVIKYQFTTPLKCDKFDTQPESATLSNLAGELYMYLNYNQASDVPTMTGGPLGSTVYTFKGGRLKFGIRDEAGSEHGQDGKRGAAEWQLFFVSPAGENAAIAATLVKATADSIPLDPLAFSSVQQDGSAYTDLNYLRPLRTFFNEQNGLYAYYRGRDTRPPCYPVSWFVSMTPLAISGQTLAQLRRIQTTNGVPMVPNIRQIMGTSSSGVILGHSMSI